MGAQEKKDAHAREVDFQPSSHSETCLIKFRLGALLNWTQLDRHVRLHDFGGNTKRREPHGNSNQQLIVNHNVLAPAPIQIGSAYILLFVVEVQQHHAMRTFVSGATGPDKICRRTLSGWATMFASE